MHISSHSNRAGHRAEQTPAKGEYTVRRGDTLSGIARKKGVSLNALIAANPQITNPNLIHPGQGLRIPPPEDRSGKAGPNLYAVRRGDNLSHIAKDHGVGLSDLIRANPQIKNPGRIFEGQQLHIPPAPEATHANRGKGKGRGEGPVVNGGLSADTLKARLDGAHQPELRRGATGQSVRQLQSRLLELGFNPQGIDGQFGPKTQAAVLGFQRSQGLVADGVVGPKTWAALNDPKKVEAPKAPDVAPGQKGSAELFVQRALAQNGDRYVFGAETNLNDKNPNTFDCSELVQWAAHQAGVTVPDGSWNQEAMSRNAGMKISVEEALRTRGALLFKPGHVAISLGDGRTIEAKGSKYGVGIFDGRGRFTSGGLIPGMAYG
jgi:peptidoglycan hydrolase-like protein with peptidoglycan-binding domain